MPYKTQTFTESCFKNICIFLCLYLEATVEVKADEDTVENIPDLEVVATQAIAGECEGYLQCT